MTCLSLLYQRTPFLQHLSAPISSIWAESIVCLGGGSANATEQLIEWPNNSSVGAKAAERSTTPKNLGDCASESKTIIAIAFE